MCLYKLHGIFEFPRFPFVPGMGLRAAYDEQKSNNPSNQLSH
jgi:hypothetical protein